MTRAGGYVIPSAGTFVPARVGRYLLAWGRFPDVPRTGDPEVDEVLRTMRRMGEGWVRAVTGTAVDAKPEPAVDWFSTTTAADRARCTDRGIRKAIAEDRLKAEKVDGRWRISPEALEHYRKANRR